MKKSTKKSWKVNLCEIIKVLVFWIILPCIILAYYFGIPYFADKSFPKPKPSNVALTEFSEIRVLNNLQDVVDKFGTRVSYSVGNIRFVEWLQKRINKIFEDTQDNPLRSPRLYLQSFQYEIDNTNLYNVIVKVTSNEIKNDDTFVLSAHMDSVLYSYGASDDGVNCLLMLEILENVLRDKESILYQPVIFVFVNDEENGFNGARAFTEHELWKNVTRFFNLESTGRGRSMIYQMTSTSIQQEIRGVKRIHLNSFGLEVAKWKVFAGTDYYPYTDSGRAGMESAFFQNGFYYHTQYDDMKNIDRGSVQYLGESVKSVVWRYCFTQNSPLSSKPDLSTQYIFYDYMNAIQVYYTFTSDVMMSILLFLWSLIFPICGIAVKYNINKYFDPKTSRDPKRSLSRILAVEFFLNLFYGLGYVFSALLGLVIALVFGLISSAKNIYTINTQMTFATIVYILGALIGFLIPQFGIKLIIQMFVSKDDGKYYKTRYQSLNTFISSFVLLLAVIPVRFYLYFYVSLMSNILFTVFYLAESVIFIIFKCKNIKLPQEFFLSEKEERIFTCCCNCFQKKEAMITKKDMEEEARLISSEIEKDAESHDEPRNIDIKNSSLCIPMKIIMSVVYFMFSNELWYLALPFFILIPMYSDVNFFMTLLPTFAPIFMRIDKVDVVPAIIFSGVTGLLALVTLFPILPLLHSTKKLTFCIIFTLIVFVSFMCLLILTFGKAYSKEAPRLLQMFAIGDKEILYNLTENVGIFEDGDFTVDTRAVDVYGISKNDVVFKYKYDGHVYPEVDCPWDWSCSFDIKKTNSIPFDISFEKVEGKKFSFHAKFNETIYSSISISGQKGTDYILDLEGRYLEKIHQFDYIYTNDYNIGNSSSLINEWRGNITFLNYVPEITFITHYCRYESVPDLKKMFDERRDLALFIWGGSCISQPYLKQINRIQLST